MNTYFDNFVVESKLNDLLATKLDTKTLMTIDSSLAAEAGMIKKINRYTYTGAVETLDKGDANTTRGAITYVSEPYEVEVAQQVFDYYDEEFLADSNVVDFGLEGASILMVNDMSAKYFAELAKATIQQGYSTFSYDTVVDAIAKMNIEDESGLFLVIGNDLKATIRKDDDFKAKELGKVIADGAIGTLSGVPVICSKRVPSGVAFLATREAVTLFTKKENEVEQVRDAEHRKNTIVMRKVNLVALTDATKVVKIAPNQATTATITTYTKNAKTVAGAATTGATVYVYINGELDGTATASSSAYSYTAKANLAANDVVTVVAKLDGYVDSSATVTVAA